jgi:hypothetical protein
MSKTFVAAAAVLAFGMSAASAATVVNGSFEQNPGIVGLNGSTFANLAAPGGASWDIFTSLPGWTKGAVGAGIEIQTAETLGTINAQDGQHYVELDSNNNSSMHQTINFASTGRYLLSFFYSPRQGTAVGSNIIDYSLFDAALPANIILAGTVTGPSNAAPVTAVGVWTKITAEFVITNVGNYNLKFAAGGTSDSLGGFIDNVSLAPVPVPAAGFLLFGALGGLVALRRRRKTA